MKTVTMFCHRTPVPTHFHTSPLLLHMCLPHTAAVCPNVSRFILADKNEDRKTDIKNFGFISSLVSFSHYFSFLVHKHSQPFSA